MTAALMDCFDTDVLIYAADPTNPTGSTVRALFDVDESGEASNHV